jgi:hypothetical protein
VLISAIENQYRLSNTGEFIINDYNSAKLFSSFFPGVAGKNGIPMWTFYVNRGQCICSMGIQDKQHPIMEFLPANWAYNLVSTQGFRTFIKFSDPDSDTFYEPFQNNLRDNKMKIEQRMIIAPAKLTLEEVNHTLGLKFKVEYYNVPQDEYAGLVRKLQIENIADKPVSLEGLDGLPLIIPYGLDNNGLKFMRRLMEAFIEVVNYENKVPFFKGKVEPADRPDVVRIKKGNFYLGFESGDTGSKLVTPIVDPVKIFGIRGDYSYPARFLTASSEEMQAGQIYENRLPCAMGNFKAEILPGKTYTYTSIIGHAGSVDELNDFVPVISKKEYIERISLVNQETIEALTQNNFICSQESLLDSYTKQNFLDNVLRGGFPYTLKGRDAESTIHLFSRKHGDLERDYNDYRLAPTQYSQGNGNFRDVNQNRRSDLFFNPDVREGNVEHFYNLIQLDGFNPLVIREIRYTISEAAKVNTIIAEYLGAEHLKSTLSYLKKPFTPGELMIFLKDNIIDVKGELDVFLGDILGNCHKNHDTDYGEGYWSDHWTYNLDLLENFLAVYPEEKNFLLFEKKKFSFYDNPHCVQPRDDKYVIWDGNAMQLNAVVFDEQKETIINQRSENPNKVRTRNGEGEVYFTSLFNKILSLVVNKLSSLDANGVGVEMEAGKPNWYDALNGLPGLMGSSLSETLEVKRHILFLLQALGEYKLENQGWFLFEELIEFIDDMKGILNAQLSPFEFWDKASTARENYRQKTRLGISGNEKLVTKDTIVEFLQAGLAKLALGIEKAWDKESNIISTYFINEAVEYEKIKLSESDGIKLKRDPRGLACFRAGKFKQTALPLFLEGPVHYLRSNPERRKAKTLALNIRQSGLYDQKLKMYKVNSSLADQPMEIGRARTFSPGWFENESIWMHMEYKYMLELLRNELYDEFYQDFKNVFVPFFKPEVYGRSILENSSFIVSSANPDPSIHGNGFVARLSGATAEFINIILFMCIGKSPFTINQENELQLHFNPALPAWLFTEKAQKTRLKIDNKWQQVKFAENTFSFMFLGSVLVTYHNNERKDTFGQQRVSPVSWNIVDLEGKRQIYKGDSLNGEIAQKIRRREVKKIDVELG